MQNIGGENAGDAFYRYKMPKLMAKIEGRGNGIKTNVVNNVEVAKALERPPEYLLKFYGCELGAQTNFDKTTGTSIVNGAHDLRKLNELCEGFIKKYVQCYSCGNPETTIRVKKDFITLKCKACGAVSDVDMRHKLNTFILKNPPENKLSKEEKRLKKVEEERMRGAEQTGDKKEKKERKEKKDKKDKDEKKKKRKDKEAGDEGGEGDAAHASDEEDEGEEEEAEDDGVVWMTDTSAQAVAARAAEQLTSATAQMVTQGNIEAEAEKERRRAEKEARKQAEEEAAARRAAAAAAVESGAKVEPAVAADALRAALCSDGDLVAVVGGVLRKLSVEGGYAGKARALVEAMFVDPPGSEADGRAAALKLPSGIKRGAGVVRALAADAPGQLALLVALEWLCSVAPARVKELAVALKVLYDEDLVEEDIILAWADRGDAAKVLGVAKDHADAARSAVAPVVEWLREGEDGGSDEGSGGESDE